MESNDRAGIALLQPQSMSGRADACKTCSTRLKLTIPTLVDTMDDRVGKAYSGMPDRLYVIDRDGRVAYQSGRGPFGFKPAEMEQALILSLLADYLADHHPMPRLPRPRLSFRKGSPSLAPRSRGE